MQKDYLKHRYDMLKASRRCVICTDRLPDGSDKARCPACLRRNANAVNRLRQERRKI